MNDAIEEFLEHYGTKGMKWGVRRKEHKTWLKQARSTETAAQVFNEAVRTFDPVIKKINNDPLFKGKNLNEDRKLSRQYDEVVGTIFNQHLAQASAMTINKTHDRAVIYQFDRHTSRLIPTQVKVAKHSVDGYPDFIAELDTNGFVIGISLNEMKQSDMTTDVDEFLSHYGVKGMKWGVRRTGQVSSTTAKTSRLARNGTDITAKQKPGKFVTTSGGKRRVAAPDAVRIAATRQLAKKSTTDALSNKQIADAVKRMQLEQQYHDLVKKTDRRNRGQKFVAKLLGDKKTQQQVVKTTNTAVKIAKTMGKAGGAAAL